MPEQLLDDVQIYAVHDEPLRSDCIPTAGSLRDAPFELGLVVAAHCDLGRVRGSPSHADLLIFVLQLIQLVVNPALG